MKSPVVINEQELVRSLREGESWALGHIYDLYADMLASRLHKLVKINSIVEELHQDVFLKLWNARKLLTDETNLKAYLLTIAKNLAIDFYRKASKDRELEKALSLHMNWSYDHIDPLLNAKDTLFVLEQLISLLPPQRQRVFRYIKLDGKSYEEASHYFGVSISTIKDHMAKSTSFLRNELNRKYPYLLFSILATVIFK